MKLKMRCLSMAMLVASISSFASGVGAVSLAFTPANQSVALGDPVTFDITISGLTSGAAPSLGVYDLDVSFDPGVLAFDSVLFGGLLGESTRDVDDSTPGTLNLFELSLLDEAELDALQPATFILASLTFNTVSAGSTDLVLSVNSLGDGPGDPLPIDSVGSGSITVVPEPSTLTLTAAAVWGLCLCRRRRVKA